MDPINFTLGVIKLPSLFLTSLSLIEKIDDYKHFRADERVLAIQFASHKLRFKKWGEALELSRETKNLSEKGHKALTDPETLQTVRQIIDAAQEIFNSQQEKNNHGDINLQHELGAEGNFSFATSLVDLPRTSPRSRITKLAWALRGKGRRERQVELFGRLVQHLYHLVPIEAFSQLTIGLTIQNDLQTVAGNASWAFEINTALKNLEEKAEAETLRELHTWLSQYLPNEIFEEAIQMRLDDTVAGSSNDQFFRNGSPSRKMKQNPSCYGSTDLLALGRPYFAPD